MQEQSRQKGPAPTPEPPIDSPPPRKLSPTELKAAQAEALARLWEEFHRLNATFFEGKLTLREIRFSTRKQYGGYYRPTESLIVLSWPSFVAFGWEETMNTFRHEVAHLVHWNHTREFWTLAEKLGSHRKYARIPENREHAYCRYVYECPACKTKVFRRRRLVRSSCARCDRQFNPAFLLRLIESPFSRQAKKRPGLP
ncbi:MAG: hypothetical protein SFU56_09980 [Capsulimonadales bacterium]|nr:hypothetical protein [Capsulimonadales bacterium]